MDVPFPMLTTPGRQPQASGGRLINCYPEKLSATAGRPNAYWRVPGLKAWGTSGGTNYRGSIVVGSLLYVAIDNTVYTFSLGGGAGTALSGSLPGTLPVIMARNNAVTPDLVIVAPGDGAFVASTTTVSSYPDPDVGQPNSVVFTKSFFIFTYGDGKTRSSDPNSTAINGLNFATAESRPDTLLRGIPNTDGQLLLCGDASIEVWGGLNDTGYPFTPITTISRGIVGPYAIAGHQDGFGKGIFLVGDDFKVSNLQGYTAVPVSVPDLDLLIEGDPNKLAITLDVYVSQGHGMVAVQGTGWCWEYDTTLLSWHERKSHLKEYWRGLFPTKAFNQWICGDRESGNLAAIDGSTRSEFGNPLRMRIETGPLSTTFPNRVRVNAIELFLTKGAGIVTGADPYETDPDIEISISRDAGQTWSSPRIVKIGRQGLTEPRVRAAIWGLAEVQGVRWRFDESAGINFGFMGADMFADKLR